MKNMYRNLLLTLILVLFVGLVGCDNGHSHHHRVKAEREVVHTYHVYHTTDNTWLWYYLMFDNTTHHYYYATSPTPVQSSSYSSLNWSRSDTKPEEIDAKETQETAQEEVNVSELGEAATEITSDYSSIPENNSLDSMEGVPESSPDTSSSVGESSSSSDAGSSSSDSGSSGGDSGGGGDGGGGGE